ncbi:MAG: hypothetical protein JWO06_2980, partial [Bacteroidota bacterium]|nr:hypothetical protein [Bacteroidota bacterium]
RSQVFGYKVDCISGNNWSIGVKCVGANYKQNSRKNPPFVLNKVFIQVG